MAVGSLVFFLFNSRLFALEFHISNANCPAVAVGSLFPPWLILDSLARDVLISVANCPTVAVGSLFPIGIWGNFARMHVLKLFLLFTQHNGGIILYSFSFSIIFRQGSFPPFSLLIIVACLFHLAMILNSVSFVSVSVELLLGIYNTQRAIMPHSISSLISLSITGSFTFVLVGVVH